MAPAGYYPRSGRYYRTTTTGLVADNFHSITQQDLRHLQNHAGFESLRHDRDLPVYVELDQVCRLAYRASPTTHQRDPVQTTKTNVYASINMPSCRAPCTPHEVIGAMNLGNTLRVPMLAKLVLEQNRGASEIVHRPLLQG